MNILRTIRKNSYTIFNTNMILIQKIFTIRNASEKLSLIYHAILRTNRKILKLFICTLRSLRLNLLGPILTYICQFIYVFFLFPIYVLCWIPTTALRITKRPMLTALNMWAVQLRGVSISLFQLPNVSSTVASSSNLKRVSKPLQFSYDITISA